MSVFGPREARVRAQTLHDRAAIHVEATIAPFSSASDRRRRGRGDKLRLSLSLVSSKKTKKKCHKWKNENVGACWSSRR